jgi:hypothetical protein
MWQDTPGLLRAEEHDLDELDLDGRELHPQDLEDGEDEPETDDDFD